MEAIRLEQPDLRRTAEARQLRDEAIRDFDRLCNLSDSPSAKLVNALAIALERQGQLTKARHLYEKHLKRLHNDPAFSMSYLRLLVAQRQFKADWPRIADYFEAHRHLYQEGKISQKRLRDFTQDLVGWAKLCAHSDEQAAAESILTFTAKVAEPVGAAADVARVRALLHEVRIRKATPPIGQ
jgi:tetratricopeptide (TPR) repeat protein